MPHDKSRFSLECFDETLQALDLEGVVHESTGAESSGYSLA